MTQLAALAWPAAWHYAMGEPTQTAVFKQHWQDFQVFEQLGFVPSGAGEHVYLDITKIDTNTDYLARQLAKHANVPSRQVTYSGLKDRHGVTRQWFAVHMPGKAALEPDWHLLASPKIHVHTVTRHHKKLRIGTHESNHFVVRLGEVAASDKLEQRLHIIGQQGVPNYFGEQRFGQQGSNLTMAARLLSGERIKDRFQQGMAMSAARSYMFNQLLSERVAKGNWLTAMAGDFYIPSDGYNPFKAAADVQIQAAIEAGEICPTGWLAGSSGRGQSSYPTPLEQHCLQGYGDWLEGLAKLRLQADRRALRLLPMDWQWQWLDNRVLELRFALLRGAYATSVLRELVCTLNPHRQDL
ncbi:MAG: tRNA pseudouridine(13) synthase TruD [Gammaproteobacteria bacterium]|jgi:tRNA pseudouridine13 synthase|nr:tRNA pseudouridine(13) synthase TruD [Gammaproteobacteria bacterium]